MPNKRLFEERSRGQHLTDKFGSGHSGKMLYPMEVMPVVSRAGELLPIAAVRHAKPGTIKV
jgi:hypothetical protein